MSMPKCGKRALQVDTDRHGCAIDLVGWIGMLDVGGGGKSEISQQASTISCDFFSTVIDTEN